VPPRKRFRLIPLALLLIALMPILAFARAGGGGHFSGHGSGGGGGGGGGDDGGLIQLLIWLIIDVPYIGVPVVIIAIIFFIYSQRKGVTLYQDSVIVRGAPAMNCIQRAAAVSELQKDDPQFSEQHFASRISDAFLVVQNAWSTQDLRSIRPFVSDGVYERFLLQIDEQKSLGLRDLMSQIAVDDVRFLSVQSGQVFQEIAVRVGARAADYEVSLVDGHRIRGDITQEPFGEIWTFLRRTGTRTIPGKPGLLEGHCPNCGALIEMNQSVNCVHCRAALRSGQFDWVLVEITQECEWCDVPVSIPGAAEMQAIDPMFNPQDLEDSASVMFWRMRTAERIGQVDPLRKVASPEFCELVAARLATPSDQPRYWFGECGVGSVRTRGLLLDDDRHRALVEIIWSGTRFLTTPDGQHQATGETGVIHTLFVLGRSPSAKTNADISVSSAHCPHCGAPVDSSASSNCAYCNTPLTTGEQSWVLTQVLPMASAEATALLMRLREHAVSAAVAANLPQSPAFAVTPSDLTLLAWAVKMACADGDLDPKEQALLQQIAERHHIPQSRLDQLISAAGAGKLETPQPASLPEARRWLHAMATAAMSDGRITREEVDLLRTIGSPFGMTDADLKVLLSQARSELYADARAALRQSRSM
jgi:predicted lipid-binding transport protein (Tim44 family)/uncharacterized tellurite resistance protein B-like protein